MIGPRTPERRSSSASSIAATQKPSAPEPSRARATGTAPWPYALALTTGRTGMPGPASSRTTARLSASASRSISSQAVRGSGGRPASDRRRSIARRAGASLIGRDGRSGQIGWPDRPEPEPLVPGPLGHRGQTLAGHGEAVGQVRGEEAGIAEPLADSVARQAVDVDAEPRGGERVEALGEQRPDRARQHVTGPTAGESGVLEGGDRRSPV